MGLDTVATFDLKFYRRIDRAAFRAENQFEDAQPKFITGQPQCDYFRDEGSIPFTRFNIT
jgi:hypothetical protein